MVAVVLGMVLSAGAQAQGYTYWGYPGYYGCWGYGYPMPVAMPVVVSSSSSSDKTEKRMKALEAKAAETEKELKMTREALLELANKVDKIDDGIKAKEPQFMQMLKDLNGRVNGVEDTVRMKGAEFADKLKSLEASIKSLEDATKPAVQKLGARVGKVEALLKKQEEDRKAAIIEGLKDRIKKLEDELRERGPAAAPPAAKTALDNFINRLQRVQVEMRDNGQNAAILDRLGKVEGSLNLDEQKLQSAIDALRSLSENADKGFLNLSNRLRLLEETQKPMPPANGKIGPELKKEEFLEPKKSGGADQKEEDGFGWAAPTTAMVIVNLPADAKVFLNGKETQSTGSKRTYVTPRLQTGKDYSYEVRAELSRDGQTVTESRRVTFQAGSRVNVSFEEMGDNARVRTVRAK